MKNNIFGIVMIIVLFTACKSHQIVGTYEYNRILVIHRLEIKKDSSFVYTVVGDLSQDETNGLWNYEQDNLCLNSYVTDFPYQVRESSDSAEMVLITLKDNDGFVVPGNYVCINNDINKHYISDNGEVTIFPYEEVKIIRVFSNNGPFTYHVSKKESNIFNISYDSGKPTYLYFINEKFDVKHKKLFKIQDKITLKRVN